MASLELTPRQHIEGMEDARKFRQAPRVAEMLACIRAEITDGLGFIAKEEAA